MSDEEREAEFFLVLQREGAVASYLLDLAERVEELEREVQRLHRRTEGMDR